MIVPFVLFLLSVAGFSLARALPGFDDLGLIAFLCALASLYLLFRAAIGAKVAGTNAQNHIILDGSNIMHWNDGTPQLETVRDVVRHLIKLGFTPGVVFDANAGHLLTGRYQHHGAMGKLLGLPEDRVMVVGKGTPADPTILAAARDAGARVVTNDRYKDWAGDFPEVHTPGHLIRGGYRDGKLWLDLEMADAGRAPSP